jgi:hypothetical protein
MVEYIFGVRTWYGVPHIVTRLLSIPRYVSKRRDESIDSFKELYKRQGDKELSVPVTFTDDEYITVPFP